MWDLILSVPDDCLPLYFTEFSFSSDLCISLDKGVKFNNFENHLQKEIRNLFISQQILIRSSESTIIIL